MAIIKKVLFLLCIFIVCIVIFVLNTKTINLPDNAIVESAYIKKDVSVYLYPVKIHENGYDVYELVSKITGVSGKLLRGVSATESGFYDHAVGDHGISHGRNQINSRYRKQYVKMMGYEYDPYNCFDAVLLSALIYRENYKTFPNNVYKLVASYRQGVQGVKQNGITDYNYVYSVLRYYK